MLETFALSDVLHKDVFNERMFKNGTLKTTKS